MKPKTPRRDPRAATQLARERAAQAQAVATSDSRVTTAERITASTVAIQAAVESVITAEFDGEPRAAQRVVRALANAGYAFCLGPAVHAATPSARPRRPRGEPLHERIAAALIATAEELDLPITMAQAGRLATAVTVEARRPTGGTRRLEPYAAVNGVPDYAETPLTHRERQVLAGAAAGWSDEEIAAWLGIRRFTVKSHLSRIYKRLNALNRTNAVALALKCGELKFADVPVPAATAATAATAAAGASQEMM